VELEQLRSVARGAGAKNEAGGGQGLHGSNGGHIQHMGHVAQDALSELNVGPSCWYVVTLGSGALFSRVSR
jgi:hypothetical protein